MGGLLGSDSGYYGNSVVTNCYYDAQVYGSKGAYSKLTGELTNGALPIGFADSTWLATEGLYPRLKAFDDYNDQVKLSVAASVVPVAICPYDWLRDVKFNFSLTAASVHDTTVVWTSSSDEYLSIADNYATVSDSGNVGLTAKIYRGNDLILKDYAITTTYTGYEGDGSASNPILISSAEQLDLVRNLADLPSDAIDIFIKLNRDIYLTDWEGENYKGWRAIADDSACAFNGSFDGDVYTIYDLSSSRTEDSCQGLFGYVGENGRVKNVKLANVTINGGGSSYDSSLYIGAIAGYNSGTISTSYATGSITRSAGGGGGCNIGGLVGYNDDGSITNCYSMISVLNTMDVSNYSYLGGLVGMSYEGTISNCYAAGVVSTQASSANISMGGLLGSDYSYDGYSAVTNCYYDAQTSTMSDTGKGTPLTTVKMKDLSSYTNWDTILVWAIDATINDGYPHLIYTTPESIAVTGVTLNKTNLTLILGDVAATLIATVVPFNAANKAVSWSSSAPDIASVDKGVVTAHAEGAATITVTTAEGNKTASCIVTVVAALAHAKGDINGDGEVNADDAKMALQADVGLITLTAEAQAVGDVTKDGYVDAADAIRILLYTAGLITTLD